jgi:Fe-Mn family superoxide dismutase
MAYELPPLPYDKTALDPHIDAMTMEIHHDRHHKAYVDNVNKAIAGNAALESKSVEALISDLAAVPENIRTAVRNNGGGHANHSMFWKLMAPRAGGAPTGGLGDDIKTTFGSFVDFQAKFEAAGLGRFGSGWAWLVHHDGKLQVISTANQDSPMMSGQAPIMGIDVWEHAYYLRYQNRRPDYVDAWWKVANWHAIGERHAKAKAGKL